MTTGMTLSILALAGFWILAAAMFSLAGYMIFKGVKGLMAKPPKVDDSFFDNSTVARAALTDDECEMVIEGRSSFENPAMNPVIVIDKSNAFEDELKILKDSFIENSSGSISLMDDDQARDVFINRHKYSIEYIGILPVFVKNPTYPETQCIPPQPRDAKGRFVKREKA